MSTWNAIRKEFTDSQHKNIRLKYSRKVCKLTDRNLVIYVSEFISGNKPPNLTLLSSDDKLYFADAIRNLDSAKGIDILIDSPGGSAEVAEAIANMLWSKFHSVRFIVPFMAKSAATLLCLSGEEILMDEQSEIGPIDPQMRVRQPNGEITYSPAHLIIQQFQSLLGTIVSQPAVAPHMAPYIQIYFPSMLQECHNAITLSETIAGKLMSSYMFSKVKNRKSVSRAIAKNLASFPIYLSHGRSIGMKDAKALGLNIKLLKNQKKLCDAVNNLYFAIKETFNRNQRMVKLCENNKGHGTVLQINI